MVLLRGLSALTPRKRRDGVSESWQCRNLNVRCWGQSGLQFWAATCLLLANSSHLAGIAKGIGRYVSSNIPYSDFTVFSKTGLPCGVVS